MRSYGQYCGVAKALDVIGDRWTILIIRELLIRGACRYTDLKNGPGCRESRLTCSPTGTGGLIFRAGADLAGTEIGPLQ